MSKQKQETKAEQASPIRGLPVQSREASVEGYSVKLPTAPGEGLEFRQEPGDGTRGHYLLVEPGEDGSAARVEFQVAFDPWLHKNPRVTPYLLSGLGSRVKPVKGTHFEAKTFVDDYKCHVTGTAFEVPTGAPIIAVETDPVLLDGRPLDEHNPSDANHTFLHPHLAMAGEDAVRRKMAQAIPHLLDEAMEKIEKAVQLACIISQDWGTAWPAYWPERCEKDQCGKWKGTGELEFVNSDFSRKAVLKL